MTTHNGRPPREGDRPPSERQDEAQDDSLGARADSRPGYGVLRALDWLDAVAATLDAGTKLKNDRLLRAAMTLPRGGDRLTGRRVVIDRERAAAVLGVSVRTLDRRVDDLVELGLLMQTKWASPGQQPEYDLTGPLTFDRTKHDSVQRSLDSAERGSVGRHRRNVRQNRGVTHDNTERERVVPPQGSKNYPPTPQEQQVLDELAAIAGQPVDGCRGPVAQALDRGWRPDQIVAKVRAHGEFSSARNVSAVFAQRIWQLGTPAPPPPPQCDNCDSNRMIENAAGQLLRCPTCHPKRAGQR